jgi:cell wall-associated NlpC family hydrolase
MTALLEQARTYLGVRFKHRGRDRNGVDCAGLVWCAYFDLGVTLPDIVRYGREPHQNGMMRVVTEGLGEPVWAGRNVPRAALQIGDVVVMRFVREPHHMGIIGDDRLRGLSLIHSYGDIGSVVEHGLDENWQGKILAVFRRSV